MTGKARRRFVLAGVWFILALFSAWLAMPGRVLFRTNADRAVWCTSRLVDHFDGSLPGWILVLGVLAVIAVLIAFCMFVQGIADACTDRDLLGRQALEGAALVALSIAFGLWAVATAVATRFFAMAVCGD